MNAHEILAILELVIYCALLPPVTFCTVYYLLKKQTAWLYLHIFTIAKIAGPAIVLSIANTTRPSTDLQIASQILYQIALGPLLSATLSFVNTSPSSREPPPSTSPPTANTNFNTNTAYTSLVHTQKGAPLNGLLRFVHPVIIIGLVLGIIGGVDRIPNSTTGVPDPDKYDKGATLSKASAALFFVAFAAIALGVIQLWRSRRSLATVSYYIISSMVVVLPLLLVRVVYSALNAANLDTTAHGGHTGKFNVLQGSWVVYFFLGFLPQAVIVAGFVGCGVLGCVRGKREKH